jgi:hypothetical protein
MSLCHDCERNDRRLQIARQDIERYSTALAAAKPEDREGLEFWLANSQQYEHEAILAQETHRRHAH